LKQHRGPGREKSYNTTAKIQKTMTCLNDGTKKERWKRMQKRARPDIRHAIPTVRPNGQPTRRMQKWARLNIRRPSGQIARHRTSEVRQLTVPVDIRSDNRQVHPGVRQQRIEDVTGRRIRAVKTSRTRHQTRVWTAHRKRKSFHQST